MPNDPFGKQLTHKQVVAIAYREVRALSGGATTRAQRDAVSHYIKAFYDLGTTQKARASTKRLLARAGALSPKQRFNLRRHVLAPARTRRTARLIQKQ